VLGSSRIREVRCNIKLEVVDLHHGLLIEPLDALASFPETKLSALLGKVGVDSKAVLLTSTPPAFVFAAVSPIIKTVTIFFIGTVLSVVSHTISIDVDTNAVHVVLGPLSEVLAAILPQVSAKAVNFIIQPLTVISGLVGPGVFTLSLLSAHVILSLILSTFRPCFNTLAVLLIVFPVAQITGTFGVQILTVTVSLVVEPHALVDVSICMVELAHAASLIELPLTFVTGLIAPNDASSSMTHAALPLSRVHGSSLISVNFIR